MAKQATRSSSRFAGYRTEAAAFRAGVTQAELSRSSYGRELIRKAETQRAAVRKTHAANERNQSFNYLIAARLGKLPPGFQPQKNQYVRFGYLYQEVTVRSDRRLTRTEAYAEASSFFDSEGKKSHYAGVETYEVFGDWPARYPYFIMVREYRGAVMRQPIILR